MSSIVGKIFTPVANAGKAAAHRAGETRLAKGVLNYDRAEARKLYDEGKQDVATSLTSGTLKSRIKGLISGSAKKFSAYMQAVLGPFYKTAYGKRN